MEQPKVVFFDAVGTLFGVKGNVGKIYSNLAKKYGVEAEAKELQTAFVKSFKASPPLAFPGLDAREIPNYEFQWWEAIAKQTFAQVGVLENFSDFSQFFQYLYGYFATKEPWYIYRDVLPVIESWHAQGIEMGIISNFDSRIHAVLMALKLRDRFSSITISSTVGAAKPDPKIFSVALKKHRCQPEEALHIGDSLNEDYHGAKALGIKAIHLKRKHSILQE